MRKLAATFAAVLALCAVTAPNAGAADHPFLFSIFKWVPEPNKIEYFEGPCGVAVDSTGDVYASNYYHNKIHVFSSGGGYKTRILEVEPLDGPCGLAVDSSGGLFVNVLHRNVTKYVPAAFPLGSKTAYGPGTVIDSEHSTGVAFDPGSGNVYVNDRTYVAVYEPSGAPVLNGGEPLRIGEATLEDAYGVAVSNFPPTDGFVYVADAGDHTVKVYDPATDLDTPVAVIDGLGTPQGGFTTLRDAALAIDQSNGHLFVAYNAQGLYYEHPKAAVAEFNPAGEYRGALPVPTPLWFGEPSGIAVDNTGGATQGRVYVTTGNSEVESAGFNPEKMEEGAVYAFGPGGPGFRLEVAVTGLGTVASSPAGIACPGACAAEYDAGEVVTLTATPDAGSEFAGWSGGGCAGTAHCTVTMSEARSVSAEFEVAPAPLSDPGGGSSTVTSASASASAAVPGASAQTPRSGHVRQRLTPGQRARLRRKARQRRRARHRRQARQRRRVARQRQNSSTGGD